MNSTNTFVGLHELVSEKWAVNVKLNLIKTA